MTEERDHRPQDVSALVGVVTDQYLRSGDFNGYPVRALWDGDEARELIALAIGNGDLSVNFGDRHPNPHIQAFEPEEPTVQLAKLPSAATVHACLYPTVARLQTAVNASDYAGRPFTLRLALGEPQLKLVAFDLRVLDQYRSDPRYHYSTDDIQGSLSVSDAFYDSSKMQEKDKVLLQHFGFGYDKSVTERVAMAFLCDLSKLSPEHQQVWKTHVLEGDYLPHPDFWRAMMGEWPERVSVFQAFGEELRQINSMATLMGRPALFREEYADNQRPREFGFLIRPTLAEFNAFVLLLDKMLSDNINLDFFQDEVEREILEERKDGKHIARQKGSIAVLDEWFGKTWKTREPEPLQRAIDVLKRIRRLRQSPAHAVKENEFDQKYFRDQRELMLDAYEAVRTLRLVFANHPAVTTHQVPDWLFKGEIWTR